MENILGIPAAKQRADYAKFELDSPPLVLSLEPRSPTQHGSLNHVGFRFDDSKELVEAQARLEAAGVSTQREDGVECCYAKQNKFWVHDMDQRLWEFYTLEEDLEHRGTGQALEEMIGKEAADKLISQEPPSVWEHLMYQPFSPPASQHHEVRLRGSFNIPVSNDEMRSQLALAFEATKPGGQLSVHVLTSEEPITGELRLPGPAAYVKYTPVRTELLAAIEAAGFTDVQLATFRSNACFEHEGLPLRETLITAKRPVETTSETCHVVFKGPFRSITDDEGNEWRRGEPVAIPTARWDALKKSTVADLFVVLPHTASVSHCGI